MEGNETETSQNFFAGYFKYLFFHTIMDNGYAVFKDAGSTVTESAIREAALNSDIIIFNMGLHYPLDTMMDYYMALIKVAQILKSVAEKYGSQIIIRGTTPQHFPTELNLGLFELRRENRVKACAGKPVSMQHPSSAMLESIARQYGFKYMDVFPIYRDR